MRKPNDPDRLENQGSAELTSMLDALRSDGPSRASMQRMTQNLKNKFEAAPTTGTKVRPISDRLRGKIGVTLLASGALLVAVRYVTHQANHGEPDALPAQAPSAVEVARQAPEHAAPQARVEVARPTPLPDLEPSSTSRPEHIEEARRSSHVRNTRHAWAGSTMRGGASRVPEPSPATDSAEEHGPLTDPSDESGSAVATSADRDEPSAGPAEQTALQRASSTLDPAARKSARVESQPTEAGLLQRAQRLASDRPTEALGILAEHARMYPNGILAPEREVLAIQILRAQSRTAEANSRLAAFRQRYPGSVYLERLEQRMQPTR